MSSDSVCQVARSWVDVGSIHMRLFGVVYLAIASVREFLDTSSYVWEGVNQIYYVTVFMGRDTCTVKRVTKAIHSARSLTRYGKTLRISYRKQ
jgi:hypothetical protein